MIGLRTSIVSRFISRCLRNTSSSAAFIEEEWFEEHLDQSKTESEKLVNEKISGFAASSAIATLDDVVKVLNGQLAKNLFVVETIGNMMNPYDYQIVCSTYNSRQASAIAENLRKLLKLDGDVPLGQAKRSTRRGNGWYVNDVNQIQVHVMSEECREKYNLESLWLGIDKENIEVEERSFMIPEEKKSSHFNIDAS